MSLSRSCNKQLTVTKILQVPSSTILKKVATPFHDDKIARPVEMEAEVKGELAPIASRVLMRLLFAARMARYDLLRAVQGLASRVPKWSTECDKSLHRLMCYANSALDIKLRPYIGDPVRTHFLMVLRLVCAYIGSQVRTVGAMRRGHVAS